MTDEVNAGIAAQVTDNAPAPQVKPVISDVRAVTELDTLNPNVAPVPQDKLDKTTAHDRARELVDGYAHALATNSPRTQAELAELKALLDVE